MKHAIFKKSINFNKPRYNREGKRNETWTNERAVHTRMRIADCILRSIRRRFSCRVFIDIARCRKISNPKRRSVLKYSIHRSSPLIYRHRIYLTPMMKREQREREENKEEGSPIRDNLIKKKRKDLFLSLASSITSRASYSSILVYSPPENNEWRESETQMGQQE